SVTGDGEDGERDIRPQRSWRSSSSSSNPICRFGGRWSRSESQDPRFIDGAIFIRLEGQRRLDDCSPRPDRVCNRIPDDVRARIVTLALDEPELSPRELAVRFTDAEIAPASLKLNAYLR